MDKDELPSVLDEEEADAHCCHFFEPSESTFEHGYVSAELNIILPLFSISEQPTQN